MTVDNIKCLIVIWLFFVKTRIVCNNDPVNFIGPRHVSTHLQAIPRQIPVSCELCGNNNNVVIRIPNGHSANDGTVNNHATVLRGHTLGLNNHAPVLGHQPLGLNNHVTVLEPRNPGPLPPQLLVEKSPIKIAPSSVLPNIFKLPLGINQQIDKQLLPNQMMHPFSGIPLNQNRLFIKETLPQLKSGARTPLLPKTLMLNGVITKISPLKTLPIVVASVPVTEDISTTCSDQSIPVNSTTKFVTTNSIQPSSTKGLHVTDQTTIKPVEGITREVILKINDDNHFDDLPSINVEVGKETRRTPGISPYRDLDTADKPIISTPASELDVKETTVLKVILQQALDQFQRKFYLSTFLKLTSISPLERRENGISFVVSGLFMYLILTAFSTEVDNATKAEIDEQLVLPASVTDRIKLIRLVLDTLPLSNEELKFRWSSRLVVNGSHNFDTDATKALRMHVDSFDQNENPAKLVRTLNRMIEEDSGGAMRDTFEEDELENGARAVLLNTVYVRARWRASPTLLNDSRPFHDAEGTPARTTRMIRINDHMGYAHLPDWDAEAVEISYSTPGLSLLVLVPRGRSLRQLADKASSVSLQHVLDNMRTRRMAVTLPIYTLRMTLLLPNKLEATEITRLVNTDNATDHKQLRLSHAVQRLMFWAEAGRNAYKDDGIEWDETPELELVVDRPYLFFVRWRNLTLMNGNFVL